MKIPNKFLVTFLFALFFMVLGAVVEARAQGGSMEWHGTVDDSVNVIVRGRNATTNTLSGQQTTDDWSRFTDRLPRSGVRVRVDKNDGRGSVYIIQQPTRRNNWTAIIRVEDRKRGRDRYKFTLYWD